MGTALHDGPGSQHRVAQHGYVGDGAAAPRLAIHDGGVQFMTAVAGKDSTVPGIEQRAFLKQPHSQSGRAHVCTPVTNAHLVCRLLLETNKTNKKPKNTTL